MTKVKICGNTNPEDAVLAVRLGADYLGLIFAESKRKIDTATAKKIMASLPDFKNFVGVFVNAPKQEVEKITRETGIRILQFHGEETALYCQHFMDQDFDVIKTFRVKDAMSLKRIDEYNVSSFLLDTFSKESSGGTGVPFDWNLIDEKPFLREKLFLAGGLNIQNLEAAIQKVKPYAVDVASGVEITPGKKDPALLEEFIRIAKKGSKQNAQTGAVRS